MSFKRSLTRILTGLLTAALILTGTALGETAERSDILKQMDTAQKVAQLLMPAFRYYTDENGEKQNFTELRDDARALLEKYGFAGVILFAQNAGDTAQTVRLVDAMQQATADGGHPQLLTAIDQEGGYITRLGHGTQMPGSMALGAVNDLTVTESAAKLIGDELRAIGFNYDAAPVVDVNNNPANPVIGIRSFSDDPAAVAEQGVAFMKGLQSAGVISTLKHFPGHGDTDTDSHTGLPCVDKTLDELKAFELIPFQACIDAGAEAVMTAHIQYPEVETGTYTSIETGETIHLPATLSKTILTDVLRGEMGFEGVIISDALNMDAIAKHFDPMDTARLAIEAGVDIILMPVDTSTEEGMAALDQYVQDVAAKVDAGEISMEKVDTAVARVLALKEKHGLLTPYAAGDIEARVQAASALVGSADNHAKEWDIARRAVTLVRDDGALPIQLDEQEKALILVPFASEVMSAEYAVALAAQDHPLPEGAEISVRCLPDTTVSDLENAVRAAKYVVMVSALYGAKELRPDAPEGMDSALMDAVLRMAHACGAKVVVVSAQLPYDAARYPEADAVVAAWSARGMTENPLEAEGSVAQYGPNVPAALYNLLTGAEFTGKLPVDIPELDESGNFTDAIRFSRSIGAR